MRVSDASISLTVLRQTAMRFEQAAGPAAGGGAGGIPSITFGGDSLPAQTRIVEALLAMSPQAKKAEQAEQAAQASVAKAEATAEAAASQSKPGVTAAEKSAFLSAMSRTKAAMDIAAMSEPERMREALLDRLSPLARMSRTREGWPELTEAQKAAGWTKYGSPGVVGYENIDDVPDPAHRALLREIEAQREAEKTIPGRHNWSDEVGMASKVISRGFSDYEAPSGYRRYYGNVDIPTLVEAVKLTLGDKYVLEGDLAVQNDEGRYNMGTFAIRDVETGELQITHQGDGKVRYHNLGEVFHEYRAS